VDIHIHKVYLLKSRLPSKPATSVLLGRRSKSNL